MPDQGDSRRWRVLWIINLGTFMSTMDIGIVNIALPSMAEQFNTGLGAVQWAATAYLLTMVALLPLLGKWSDRTNRGKVYAVGFAVFTLGSLFAALSVDLLQIISSRIVQGVGAGMIMANSQAMIRQLFPDKERGKALGINAVIISAGTLAGPAVGGLLLDLSGWPMLFLINLPFGIAAAVLGWLWFPATSRGTPQRLDLVGSLLIAVIAVLFLWAAQEAQESGTASLWPVLAAALLLPVLIVYERKLPHAVLDRQLFADRTFRLGNISAFLIHFVQMGSLVAITFYMQGPLGYTAAATGLLLAIQPLAMGLAAPFSGWYRDRFGARAPLLAGALLCALSATPLLWPGAITFWMIGLYALLFGLGIGLFQSTNNAEIMSAAPAERSSLAGSLLALIRFAGMSAGIGFAAALAGQLAGGAEQYVLFPELAVEAAGKLKQVFAGCLIVGVIAVWFVYTRFYRLSQREEKDLENAMN